VDLAAPRIPFIGDPEKGGLAVMVNNQVLTVSKLSKLQKEILAEFDKGAFYGHGDFRRLEKALSFTDVVDRIAERRELWIVGFYGNKYIENENSLKASVSRSLKRLVSRGFLEKSRWKQWDENFDIWILYREYSLTEEGQAFLEVFFKGREWHARAPDQRVEEDA